MGARLFVGNLNRRTTERQLERFFSSWGTVTSVKIPPDRQTGRSRGFGFVEFPSEELAELALAVFNGRMFGGRVLRLSEAAESPQGEADPWGRLPGHGRSQPRSRSRAASALGVSRETSAPGGVGDYVRDHGVRRHKGGKHGSDRKRAQGTRRVIE